MTLRDLVLKMYANEKLMIRRVCEGEFLETTPEEIINEYGNLHNATVEEMWVSYNLYEAIMITIK